MHDRKVVRAGIAAATRGGGLRTRVRLCGILGTVAGGMTPKRDGLSLAERSALSGVDAAAYDGSPVPGEGPGRRPGPRHCWVSELPGAPARCPGLLAEWARREGDRWFGRVVYAVPDRGQVVLVEAWVAAEHLEPAHG